jgi:hypothetical protein
MNYLPKAAVVRRGVSPLSYAMHRILNRMILNDTPFAVFAEDGCISIRNSSAKTYNRRLREEKNYLVGVYDFRANAEDILDDLKAVIQQ